MKGAVEPQKDATFDRCSLSLLSASSLDFEVVYWMETSDYNAYIDAHHKILVRMLEAFRREKLQFGFPRSVSITKELPRA